MGIEALLALAMQVAPSGPPLGADDLFSQAVSTMTHQPKDAFDAPPDTARLAGRRFRVVIPVWPEGDDRDGFATWRYDAAEQLLTVAGAPTSWAGYEWKAKGAPKGYLAVGKYYEDGSRLVPTTRGSKVRIKSSGWFGFGLGSWEGSPPAVKFTATLAPSLAKDLSAHLAIAVEGEIRAINPTQSIVCGSRFYEASIDDRNEQFNYLCVYNARIDRIAVVDLRTDREVSGSDGAGPTGRPITNPDWERKPSPGDVAMYAPTRALANGVRGRATIRCAVNAEGELRQCALISEDPPGHGFGDAALRLGWLYKMRSRTEDGRPVEGGTVTLPIPF